MRAILVLSILCAATADAQPSAGQQAAPEGWLTPPPITSAPQEAPPPGASPEEEFTMPSFQSAPPQEVPAPPSAPHAVPAPTPPPPSKSSVAPAPRQPAAPSPTQPTRPKSSGPSVLEMVTVPIGAGLLVGGIASRITDNRSTVTSWALGAMGVTTLAMITIVGMRAIRDTPEEFASRGFEAAPVPVVLSAGRGNEGLAAGPGLFLRF